MNIMTISFGDLDAHEQPSEALRAEWKSFSRLEPQELAADPRIDDPRAPLSDSGFLTYGTIPTKQIVEAFGHLGINGLLENDAPIIHHPLLPGLLIMPNLLPENVQTKLIDLMVHRDLSNPTHQTNMHLHFNLPYPPASTSFFTYPPDSATALFTPKDTSVHKPLSMHQVLNKRLHWVTLGGQYDWTNRVYPEGETPGFPQDIGGFLESLWPETEAQAAIVNFYGGGDTMMMHRDVSEEIDKGLVSISLGCDGLFMIAPSNGPSSESQPEVTEVNGKPYLCLRLRSGDAIYMTKESRYAWHGVPKVVKGTCPEFLRDWPAREGEFEKWKGWMGNKRINLNVRQMKEVVRVVASREKASSQ